MTDSADRSSLDSASGDELSQVRILRIIETLD